MTQSNREWLDSLNPGDRVMIVNGGGGYAPRVSVSGVARRTKTQIILNNGSRFRSKDGTEVGRNAWHWSTINPVDERRIMFNNQKDRLLYAIDSTRQSVSAASDWNTKDGASLEWMAETLSMLNDRLALLESPQ